MSLIYKIKKNVNNFYEIYCMYMDYYNKYLKYKNKYINLKYNHSHHIGGTITTLDAIGVLNSNTTSVIDTPSIYINKIQLDTREQCKADAYFVFEQLTDINVNFWDIFGKTQQCREAIDGVIAFKHTIMMYFRNKMRERLRSETCENQIWIAYVSRIEPDNTNRVVGSLDDHIEMIFTVFISHNTPITSHVGIFRTCEYIRPSKKALIFPKLSLYLHAFAGAMSKKINPKVLFMVTKPMPRMSQILVDAFEAGSEIILGSQRERETGRISEYTAIPEGGILTHPILDDTEEDIWQAPEDNTTFERPIWIEPVKPWINDKTSFMCAHHFLKDGDIPTLIVKISALVNKWENTVQPK